MEILVRRTFLVKYPACKSVLKVKTNDIQRNILGGGFIVCPVCKKHTVIYQYNGELNNQIQIKLIDDDKRTE